jgi:Phage integrase, N-terminal SAM-like domain
MTPLQQRLLAGLQLRGLSEWTQEAYVRAVRQLADHYHKSPARITAEELRVYNLVLSHCSWRARHFAAPQQPLPPIATPNSLRPPGLFNPALCGGVTPHNAYLLGVALDTEHALAGFLH